MIFFEDEMILDAIVARQILVDEEQDVVDLVLREAAVLEKLVGERGVVALDASQKIRLIVSGLT